MRTVFFFYVTESDTRVETRYMYPDPPTTNDALDIQQQALLREQNKKLKKLRKNAEGKLGRI